MTPTAQRTRTDAGISRSVQGYFVGFAGIHISEKLHHVRQFGGSADNWMVRWDDTLIVQELERLKTVSIALRMECHQYALPYVETSRQFEHAYYSLGEPVERTTDRAAVLIIRGNQLLIIYRNKHGRAYYVLPGGGVEAGETPVEAAQREVWEETSLRVSSLTLIHTIHRQHHIEYYYSVQTTETCVTLQGPEQHRQSPDNIYQLMWVSLDMLTHLEVQPLDIRPICLAVLQQHTA